MSNLILAKTVMLIPKNHDDKGIVIEFKSVDDPKDLASESLDSINQIKEKSYQNELVALGIRDIMFVGIAFAGKEVKVLALEFTDSNP